MKYLEQFLNHLKLIHREKSTIYFYKYFISKAFQYFKGNNIYDEKEITEEQIIKYLIYLKEKADKVWYYYMSVRFLKFYFGFLEKEKIILINPMMNIDIPKEPCRRIKPIPKEELLDILSNLETKTDFGIRSKAIFEVFYSTGIRPSELRNIKILQVDYIKKEIFIEKGKCLKDRVVPIGNIALEWIQKYLKEVRPKFVRDKTNPYLFITINLTGRKLTKRGLEGIIAKTFKLNNIKGLRAYSFRVSCATHCLLNGMDTVYIQKLLGHESIRTTKSYLHVDENDLKNILNKKHPRNKY